MPRPESLSLAPLTAQARGSLLARAREAVSLAYAPYSSTRIGAAVLVRSGKVYMGASVGNASSALNCCAEQAAVLAAVMAGERDLAAIAVAQAVGGRVVPCGRCLQLLAEFASDMWILTDDGDGLGDWRLSQLLPVPYRRPPAG